MIFEMRRYECMPQKLNALNRMMETLALPVFKRLGIHVVGCWTAVAGETEDTLIYILAFDSLNDRQSKWNAFLNDPEWKAKRAIIGEQEGGPLVARVTNSFLAPTCYSPLQ